jgi:hypothetical protein
LLLLLSTTLIGVLLLARSLGSRFFFVPLFLHALGFHFLLLPEQASRGCILLERRIAPRLLARDSRCSVGPLVWRYPSRGPACHC